MIDDITCSVTLKIVSTKIGKIFQKLLITIGTSKFYFSSCFGNILKTSSNSHSVQTLRRLPVLPMQDHHTNYTNLLNVRSASCMNIDQPGIAAPLAKNHTMNPTAPISTIIGGINLSFIKVSQLSFAVHRPEEVPPMTHAGRLVLKIILRQY